MNVRRPAPARARSRRLAALGLACTALAAASVALLAVAAPGGADGSVTPAATSRADAGTSGGFALLAAAAAVEQPVALRGPPAPRAVVAAPGIVDEPPGRLPRPGSERDYLEAFLRSAREPGADPVALADRVLAGEAPAAGKVAALRGLVQLRPPGTAACLGRALSGTAADPPPAEVADYAARRLIELAPADAAARGELRLLLSRPASGIDDPARRRRAASSLAASSPRNELLALAPLLSAEKDDILLAGVHVGLEANPEAAGLGSVFPVCDTSSRGVEP